MENMVRDVKEIQEVMVNVGVILDLDIKFEDNSDLELIKLGRGVTTQKSRDVYPIIINYGENGIYLSGVLNTYYYHERQLETLIEELEYYYSMSGRDLDTSEMTIEHRQSDLTEYLYANKPSEVDNSKVESLYIKEQLDWLRYNE